MSIKVSRDQLASKKENAVQTLVMRDSPPTVPTLPPIAGLAVEFGSKKGSAQSSAASEVASVNLDNDDEGCEEVAVMLSGKVRFHMY